MTNRTNDIPLRQAAVVAGVGLLIMAILAPFAEFSVRQSLIVPGDAATSRPTPGIVTDPVAVGITQARTRAGRNFSVQPGERGDSSSLRFSE